MKAVEPKQSLRIVLYEGRGADPLEPADRLAVLQPLLDAGYTVTCTGTGSDAAPSETAHDGTPILILGRFGGNAPPLADADGKVTLLVIDLDGQDLADLPGVVDTRRQEAGLQVNRPGEGWKPWFPVIDYDRCTNCMQCLSFCLFDVYGTSGDGKIQVQNQDNCKTDCPACSRVCPEVAILFPKYKAGPINGDVVRESDVNREAMKVDISALLGGDIYEQLRSRSESAKQRFARERDDKRALSERMRCLNKLAGQMDIPMEVLKSLPSQDQIRQKAEAAKQKAAVARGDNGRT
ncbi:MAG: ferredoxin family protein [Phycisphaeraceae bacterium]|nr:ferredoxin family protein [Phycisphaeraceae bacterium]